MITHWMLNLLPPTSIPLDAPEPPRGLLGNPPDQPPPDARITTNAPPPVAIPARDSWEPPAPTAIEQSAARLLALPFEKRRPSLNNPAKPPLPADMQASRQHVDEFWRSYWRQLIVRRATSESLSRGIVYISFSPAAMNYLADIEDSLQQTRGVYRIDTSGGSREFGDRFAEMCARLISRVPTIHEIEIYSSYVTDKGALALAAAIEQRPEGLRSLRVVDNLLRDKGQAALRSLRDRGTLGHLAMGDNMSRQEQHKRRVSIVHDLLVQIPLYLITPSFVRELLAPNSHDTPSYYWALAKNNWKKLTSG